MFFVIFSMYFICGVRLKFSSKKTARKFESVRKNSQFIFTTGFQHADFSASAKLTKCADFSASQWHYYKIPILKELDQIKIANIMRCKTSLLLLNKVNQKVA